MKVLYGSWTPSVSRARIDIVTPRRTPFVREAPLLVAYPLRSRSCLPALRREMYQTVYHSSQPVIRTQLAHYILAFPDLVHDRCVTFAHSLLLCLVDMSRMELDLVRNIPHALEPRTGNEVDHPATKGGGTQFVDKWHDEAEQSEARRIRTKRQAPRVNEYS